MPDDNERVYQGDRIELERLRNEHANLTAEVKRLRRIAVAAEFLISDLRDGGEQRVQAALGLLAALNSLED